MMVGRGISEATNSVPRRNKTAWCRICGRMHLGTVGIVKG